MIPELADRLIKGVPYAKTLGPTLPALHGGAIGGFMEVCAMAELQRRAPDLPLSKPIGVNIDYLRRGKPIETFARADIFKEGSRVANVRGFGYL